MCGSAAHTDNFKFSLAEYKFERAKHAQIVLSNSKRKEAGRFLLPASDVARHDRRLCRNLNSLRRESLTQIAVSLDFLQEQHPKMASSAYDRIVRTGRPATIHPAVAVHVYADARIEVVLVARVLDEILHAERHGTRQIFAKQITFRRELNRLKRNAPLDLLGHHLDELLATFVLSRRAVDRAPKRTVEPASREVVIAVFLAHHLEWAEAVDRVSLARAAAVLVTIVADEFPRRHLPRIETGGGNDVEENLRLVCRKCFDLVPFVLQGEIHEPHCYVCHFTQHFCLLSVWFWNVLLS